MPISTPAHRIHIRHATTRMSGPRTTARKLRVRLEAGQLKTWPQFSRTIEESPALLARRRQYAARMEQSIAEALQTRGPLRGSLMSTLIAAQYAAAQKVLEDELARILPADDVLSRMEPAIAQVFGVLRHGLGKESV
jgi:hypothetical protein